MLHLQNKVAIVPPSNGVRNWSLLEKFGELKLGMIRRLQIFTPVRTRHWQNHCPRLEVVERTSNLEVLAKMTGWE